MKTPLYNQHIALGAKMAPFGGWDMPIQYEGILAEHQHTRKEASLFDICHMGEFELSGLTAGDDLEHLLTQRISTMKIGQCRYGYLLNDTGGVLDDLTCYRLKENTYYLVVNAATSHRDAEWIQAHLSAETAFRDLSSDTAKIDIQGPDSRRQFEAVLGRALPDLKYFNGVSCELLGQDCFLSRTGYTGEWGYEIYLPAKQAEYFWTTFLQNPNIKPCGLGARDTLRLEMGYPLYGHELFEDRTPMDASRGMFIDFNKDFIGKDAVLRGKTRGSSKLLVGLKLESKRAARAGDKILFSGAPVGFVTSGSLAPSLGVAVALAYIDSEVSEPGQLLEIEVRGKKLPAEVVSLPFYGKGTARGVK